MTGAAAGLARLVAGWRPPPHTDTDHLAAAPVAALSAVLGEPSPAARDGEPLPALWHWLYFLDWPAHNALGPDGHPRDGRFLPPIPDRRRMFAGGRLEVHRPLVVGTPAVRTSSLVGTTVKRGRTGEILFVTVRYELLQNAQRCLVEEQDIVGDGGLGMVLAELETVARLRLPVTIVVFNDSTLSLIKIKQKPHGHGGTAAVEYRPMDFAGIAEATGIPAHRVSTESELDTVIRQALGHDGPTLIDAIVNPAEYPHILSAIRGGR